jgi:hypothetical protein
MEWSTLLEGVLTGSPMALVLGFAVWTLWQANQKKEAEIQRLNEARIKDMIEVANRDD